MERRVGCGDTVYTRHIINAAKFMQKVEDERGSGIGGIEVGIDVEDAILIAAVDDDRAIAGVVDCQVAARQDVEIACGIGVLIGASESDFVNAWHSQVDSIAAWSLIGLFDGGTQCDGATRRSEDVGQTVDVEDGRHQTILVQAAIPAHSWLGGRLWSMDLATTAFRSRVQLRADRVEQLYSSEMSLRRRLEQELVEKCLRIFRRYHVLTLDKFAKLFPKAMQDA